MEGKKICMTFATTLGEQVLWIQAEDSPPVEHFAHYSRDDLAKLKRKWLTPTYHAKKTEGILSLFPFVYDEPLRVTSGQSPEAKEYGVHNGSRCKARALCLHTVDEARLASSECDELVLKHLPTVLWVELEAMHKQYPDAPRENWFPLRPVTVPWRLDGPEYIEIIRKGFPVVPDFSSTIHVATGRTLESCKADLGGFEDLPSYSSAMRNYIALSRVKNADSLLIARPFSPMLFQQGPQPWPSLLTDVLTNAISQKDLGMECLRVRQKEQQQKQKSRLKEQLWKCGLCHEYLAVREYIKA